MFFSVHCCSNLFTGYNFGNISIMQTQETQNISSQSFLTASKRSSQSKKHRKKSIWNAKFDIYKFGSKDFWSMDVFSYTLPDNQSCAEDACSLMQ